MFDSGKSPEEDRLKEKKVWRKRVERLGMIYIKSKKFDSNKSKKIQRKDTDTFSHLVNENYQYKKKNKNVVTG